MAAPNKFKEEGEKDPIPMTPSKTPIILAKPPQERGGNLSPESSSITRMLEKAPGHVVLLKSREGSVGSITSPTKETSASSLGGPTPIYQIHQKASTTSIQTDVSGGESRLAPPLEMKSSIKLVDEGFQWCDNGMEFLQDQTDFFVVGVLGLQGVGKSTVMSLLAGNKSSDTNRNYVFTPQNADVWEVGAHQTSGIDMFITSERVILLDAQPLLSASILDHMIQYEKKYPSEYSTAENCIEMQSLQLAAFLMTVCNVILVLQDWFVDANLLRFIQTAEMLKPPTPSPSHESGTALEDVPEYYPHLVFVQNKAKRKEFTSECFLAMQNLLTKVFLKSKLKYRGSVSLAKGTIMPSLSPQTVQGDVNLFLLPEMEKRQKEEVADGSIILTAYQGFPSFEFLLRSFRNQILSMPRSLLTHTSLSEKNWFHYAARTWEAVKKTMLLSEYNRLLP